MSHKGTVLTEITTDPHFQQEQNVFSIPPIPGRFSSHTNSSDTLLAAKNHHSMNSISPGPGLWRSAETRLTENIVANLVLGGLFPIYNSFEKTRLSGRGDKKWARHFTPITCKNLPTDKSHCLKAAIANISAGERVPAGYWDTITY